MGGSGSLAEAEKRLSTSCSVPKLCSNNCYVYTDSMHTNGDSNGEV